MGEGFTRDHESARRRATPEDDLPAGLASTPTGALAAVTGACPGPREREAARLLDAAAAAQAAGRWRQGRRVLASVLEDGAALPAALRARLGETALAVAAGAEADGDWRAAAAVLEPLLLLGIAAETASARLQVVRRREAGTVALSQAKAAFAAGRWQESLDAAQLAAGALPTNTQARELRLLAAAEIQKATRRRRLGSLYRAAPTAILLLGVTAVSVWGGHTGEGPAGFLATMPPVWESIVSVQPTATPTPAWTSAPSPTPSLTATGPATASATSTRSAERQSTLAPAATTPAQTATATSRQPTNTATRVPPVVPPANTPVPAATATRTPAPAARTPTATGTSTSVPPGTPPATVVPPRVPPGTPPATIPAGQTPAPAP